MEILRDGNFSIKKEIIDLSNLDIYNEERISNVSYLIPSVMEEYPISTFGMITLLRENYYRSLEDTIKKISGFDYDKVRCNCYYLSKVLKEKLNSMGIKSYYLTYKANHFALNSGDKIAKEAHISLLYPTIKNDRIYYTIFDPGLKIVKPLSFYRNEGMDAVKDNDLITLIGYENSDNDYPYYVNMDGINPYSYNRYPHNVCQRFNPNYETVNIVEMLFPISYYLLTGYKATIFSKDISKRAYVTLYHIDRKVELFDEESNMLISYSYDDIMQMDKNILINKLKDICKKLDLDLMELLEDIYFMIDVHDEYMNSIMNKQVLNE